MEQVCHRCREAVHECDPFCPHCGAPQLRYEAPEEPATTAGAAPAQRSGVRDFSIIRWREAIRDSAILAIPAGLLSSLIGLEALWVIAGSMAVISLYRRHTGILPTSSVGWKIGALLGLFAAAVSSASDGVTLLVQRYALHEGSALDQHYRDFGKQFVDQLTRSNPQGSAMFPAFLHFWSTPDGVAAMVLINTAGVVISMLIFAAAGGALGARLTARTAHSNAG